MSKRNESKTSADHKIILAVGAHQDDTDFTSSGSIAKWVKQGSAVYYLLCTNGNKGSDDPKMTSSKLAKIRRKEQENAAKVLGVKKVFFLNYNDGELAPTLKLKKEIVKIIRKIKPTLVVTLDPSTRYSIDRGYINHPDHIAAAEATLSAVFPLARDRLTFPDLQRKGLAPHKVKELLMTAFDQPNFFIDITHTIDLKIQALKEHKSQIKDHRQMEKMIKEWARLVGKKSKVKYAEGFKRIFIRP
ncbi:hypothetical protein A2165_00895 [Candidatus Curtissbacteria bacterium RBG_13_40_7]|uniref:GlcNAc-PI de-N-acetylase n=1 Tax=Candidatus Curtissbacteria bacterium RBG_13_40_7 TaxID=1797706 RepID=A0A1F5FWS3_9BACT|nr:MAG: hypothetical protein A2165_00895 [Candidatus Curtissbacteria bacterium RBG_13_40_7]